MKISISKPPIYDEAAKLFGLKEGDHTFFTYGDTIYNPDGVEMPHDLIVHEQTHGYQQEMDEHVASLWWKRYIADPQFRLEQECDAYAQQYRYICSITKNREKRARYLFEMAKMLASPMYGSIVTQAEAMKMLKK